MVDAQARAGGDDLDAILDGGLVQGRALRDQGMDRAIEAARAEYRAEFYAIVDQMAAAGTPFTSEDVINIIGLPSGSEGLHRNNAVGALMAGAAKRGVIVRHGSTTQSRRSASHAAELTYWIGAEHAKPQPTLPPHSHTAKIVLGKGQCPRCDIGFWQGFENA